MARGKLGFTLIVLGDSHATTIAIEPHKRLRIGRDTTCEVCIPDASLSRVHASLELRDGQAFLRDENSRNGTMVGDARLPASIETALPLGSLATLGSVTLVVEQRQSPRQTRHVWSADAFAIRLAEECARATPQQQGFSLLRIQAADLENILSDAPTPIVVGGVSENEVMVVSHARVADIEAFGVRALGKGATLAAVRFPDDARTAHELMNLVTRGVEDASGRLTLEPALTQSHLPEENAIVFQSAKMQSLFKLARRAASGDISILLLGETGSGKDVLARWIHAHSPRAEAPFVAVNCAAIPASLFESEVFGHEKGSFSGATDDRAGYFEQAHGGTLFLDEIGELPVNLQAKILRCLEDRAVRRVGALDARAVDTRIIAATHRDLELDVAAQRFRADLFYRLNGFSLQIPPLRERPEDISLLATRFIARACIDFRKPTPLSLSESARQMLLEHDWPGNVRELRNAVERAVVMCKTSLITAESFQALRRPVAPPASIFQRIAEAVPEFATLPLRERLAHVERMSILIALEDAAGNRQRAAELLGLPRSSFWERCQKYGVALGKADGEA